MFLLHIIHDRYNINLFSGVSTGGGGGGGKGGQLPPPPIFPIAPQKF
ncbi:MAG: hypothetical protein GY820_07610 [Gammaproteobacteria bacterium]|nr:hypothetical protein [Gammaproteobacteria bacterium]